MSMKTSDQQKTDGEYWQMLPKCLLGIRMTTLNKPFCMDFVSDDSIMYPCGIYMVLFNLNKNTKQLIPLENSEEIVSIYIFLERRLIVLEERTNENKVNLHFLDIETGIKTKSISMNFSQAIVDMKFSSDGSRLLIQNEGLMWPLSLWLYDKTRLVCSTNVIDHTIKPKHNVKEISFYPNKKKKVIVIGDFVFQSFSIIDDNFVIDWEILNTECLSCHLWTSSNEILLGNDTGQMLWFNIESLAFGAPLEIDQDCEKKHKKTVVVNTIVKFSRGLICLVNKKNVYFYKRNNDSNYEITHLIGLPTMEHDLELISKRSTELIQKLILNRSENILICATNWKRIYKLELTNEAESSYNLNFTLVESYHFETILSLDVCHRKPLIVTCGKDNLFQMWNYETEKLEYSKYFDEDLLSVAIHPTGLYLAIACFEKINYCTIYFEDVRCTKIFNTGNCHQCAFSNGGQYLAASTVNLILIYSTVTYEEKIILKEAYGKLRHFVWTKDDDFIITCSNTGSVCLWDTDTGEKIGEYVTKTNGFLNVSLFQSKSAINSVFILESGLEIKELSVALSEYGNAKKLPIKNEDLILQNSIRTDNDNRFTTFSCDMFGFMLLAGQSNGRIRVIPYPYLKEHKRKYEFCGHHTPITRLRFSHDNNHMISCSSDGTVIVWNVSASFSFQDSSKLDNFDEILITKTDLQARKFDQILATKNLAEKNEIAEYDLRLKEMSNSEKTKALDYNCKLNLTAMRSVLKELKIDSDVKAKEFDGKMQKIIKMFEKDLNTVQENSEKELIQKYFEMDALSKAYQKLLDKKNKISASAADTINENDADDEKEIEIYYNCKLRELEETHKKELQQLQYKIKLCEEENKQIELQGDEEVEILKRNCERKLNFYRKDNKQLQLDICFMRKKLINDEEKVQNLNNKREAFTEFLIYKKNKHKELEKHIETLKKHVNMSTRLLTEKDEKAFKMKQKNQQLEKMRFINEHQIIDFQNDIKPLREQNELLLQNIDEYEAKCQLLTSQLRHLHSLKEGLEGNLSQANRNLVKIKEKYYRVQTLEKLIHQAVIDLNQISDADEVTIKQLLLKIYKKLPKLNEEISIDKEALAEIDTQTENLKSVIREKEKEIRQFDVESKEAAMLIIQENLVLGENFKEIESKCTELENRFKNIKKKFGLTKSSAAKFINSLMHVIKIFNLGENHNQEASLEANLQQMQLKMIEDVITECNEQALVLKSKLKEDDPEYDKWINITDKYLKMYVINKDSS